MKIVYFITGIANGFMGGVLFAIIGDCVEKASDHISAAAMSQIGAGFGNFGTLALMKYMMDDLGLKGAANYIGSIFYMIALFALCMMMWQQKKREKDIFTDPRPSIITIQTQMSDEQKKLIEINEDASDEKNLKFKTQN